MTTDEALEYCKRFDDPKLREQMGTDFSRATGSVGALLALRAELERIRTLKCSDCGEEFKHGNFHKCFECCSGELYPVLREKLATAEAELSTLRGKLRELDAWLTEKGEAQSDQFGNYGDSYREGKADAYDAAGTKLRRLGLVESE